MKYWVHNIGAEGGTSLRSCAGLQVSPPLFIFREMGQSHDET